MITDEELNAKIIQVCDDFIGQLDDLYAVVGMIVVGRRYGWRVMRLISPRRHWTLASNLFGDPKYLMPKKGDCYSKSLGCRIIDETGKYWEYIRGHMPLSQYDRKKVQEKVVNLTQ